eukprot:362572-Chlamydomonas_euryale.AAC.2
MYNLVGKSVSRSTATGSSVSRSYSTRPLNRVGPQPSRPKTLFSSIFCLCGFDFGWMSICNHWQLRGIYKMSWRATLPCQGNNSGR